MNRLRWTLVLIVVSQFCCTSLWFAGNAVLSNMVLNFGLNDHVLGHLTTAVQLGFIAGTLLFAFLTIADRYSPSKVFFVSALLGATCNAIVIFDGNTLTSLLGLRFLTGFFLAGIYPVGMKIAADYYQKSLGKSLGFLVGALVVGTAFPHLLNGLPGVLPWKFVLLATSGLAVTGGILMLTLVPDGPYRKKSQQFDFSAFYKIFRQVDFRAAAFGYFGHMWELYAFWAFVPVMLVTYNNLHTGALLNVSLLSFAIIAVGGLACVLGGYLSEVWGAKRTAGLALFMSGLCCLLSPLLFLTSSVYLFVGFLLFWGMVVVADSPLFSTLVAQNASPEVKGTALTIVNCIGFSITIFSIQLLSYLMLSTNPVYIYMLLAAGPALGLVALFKK